MIGRTFNNRLLKLVPFAGFHEHNYSFALTTFIDIIHSTASCAHCQEVFRLAQFERSFFLNDVNNLNLMQYADRADSGAPRPRLLLPLPST